MQTPGQGVFGDSLTLLSRTQEDASKLVATAANVVPGAPAALAGGDDTVAPGKLVSVLSGSAQDMSYGVFVNPPANSVYGRQTLGEFDAKRADVLLQGNVLIRDCVYMDVTTQVETTISLWDVKPTAADIGKGVGVIEVADGFATGTDMLKWTVTNIATADFGTAAAPIAKLVGVSDDATEFELAILGVMPVAN
jgi:hypothetical protein